MNKEQADKLLEKYYKGETELDEEALLKDFIAGEEETFADEQLIFDYYKEEAKMPEGMEDQLLKGFMQQQKPNKTIKLHWMRYASVAAVLLLGVVFWFSGHQKHQQMLAADEQFALMERALMEVSIGVQPPENDEVVVLFKDENLEIIAK